MGEETLVLFAYFTAAKAAVQLTSKRATQPKHTDRAGKLQIIVTKKLLQSSNCKLTCSGARGCSLLLLTVLNETPREAGICRKEKNFGEIRTEQNAQIELPLLELLGARSCTR